MSVNQFQVMRALKIPRFFRIINSGLKPFEDFHPCLLIDLRPQRAEEAPGGQWHLKSIGMKSGEWPSRDVGDSYGSEEVLIKVTSSAVYHGSTHWRPWEKVGSAFLGWVTTGAMLSRLFPKDLWLKVLGQLILS